MTLFRRIRRSYLIIVGGVFLICLSLFRLVFAPEVGGGKITVLDDATIPTPVIGLTHTAQVVPTQASVNDEKREPGPLHQPEVLSPRVYSSRMGIFGREPKMAAMFEQLQAVGKEFPVWIRIPSIDLSVPIVPATMRKVLMDGKTVDMWFAPDLEAAGWHTSSALPGELGNLVLSGHNNDYGKVFRRLQELKSGELIELTTQKRTIHYQVSNRVLFQEVEIDLGKRMENARWISPSADERLTLVTCWPDDSNTHRLIIVASPQ